MATKEKREIRLSGRIRPSLNRKATAVLKKLPKWTMSDLIEEGLLTILSNPETLIIKSNGR